MNAISPSPESSELLRLLGLYFERSEALQSYWTLYAVIIGGLLAFASLRRQPSTVTTVLVAVLFAAFAFKNLGAIGDTLRQRGAILEVIRSTSGHGGADAALTKNLVPVLEQQDFGSVARFHVACDVLTVLTLGAMEVRRRRNAGSRDAGPVA